MSLELKNEQKPKKKNEAKIGLLKNYIPCR